jgi:hypothetical protein
MRGVLVYISYMKGGEYMKIKVNVRAGSQGKGR